jgi:hypothetical protein
MYGRRNLVMRMIAMDAGAGCVGVRCRSKQKEFGVGVVARTRIAA